MEVVKALIVWAIVFILRLVVIMVGLFVVPFAIPKFKFTGQWELIRLAKWADPWDNPKDGILGDTRLHYWLQGDQYPAWLEGRDWLKAYWWMAIRNPANNFSRFYRLIGCNLADSGEITILAFGGSWEFTKVKGKRFSYWGFYKLTDKREVKLGHKIRSKYIGASWVEDPLRAWKGFTFRVKKLG